jgi:hypothetical protein
VRSFRSSVPHPQLLLAASIAVLALLTACGGDDDDGPTQEEIQQALVSMVLQPNEIPEGLESLGSNFADNTQAATGLGTGPTKEQLDAWGRMLGYQSDYQRAEPANVSAANALSTAASLYEDDQGAADSFSERVGTAREADWQASHADLTEFQQEELDVGLPADDSLWLHLTGFQATDPNDPNITRLVSDDILVFRVGRAWGYLNVVSLANVGVDDRAFANAQVETLARTQIEHMRRVLDSGVVD